MENIEFELKKNENESKRLSNANDIEKNKLAIRLKTGLGDKIKTNGNKIKVVKKSFWVRLKEIFI